MNEQLYIELCDELGKDIVFKNEKMSEYTTFRIGGPCDVMMKPKKAEDILTAIDICTQLHVPYTVIGNGSNLLVSDEGIEGLVIVIAENMSNVCIDGNIITAQAGASLARVSREAQKAALTGLEFAAGIPGTVGGGTAMNAGAYNGEIKNVLKSVKVIENGKIKEYSKDQLHMGYRNTDILKYEWIVCEAQFELANGNSEDILAMMNDFNHRRREKQPLSLPSAGSTFKRPEGYFAGKLIQDAGLMGYCSGGAGVSTLHAGFVVNNGGATFEDVCNVIRHVQKTVFEKFGVNLETEVRIIGR